MNTAEISFVVILGVMVAFYLIFIRPAAKEQKRVQATIRDLAVGDDVITTAGFFATIRSIETPEEGPVQITLDFGNGVIIRALTSSIMQKVSTAEQPVGTVEEAGVQETHA
jgi:preprotein translocase YajC subunit